MGLVGVFGKRERERERGTRVPPFILGGFWDKSLLLFSLNCFPGHASFVETLAISTTRKKL